MFKNYFKIAWRNLIKNKIFSFINIVGLAIGMTCAGLIFLWVGHELQYDSVNIKKDRLYSVVDTWLFSGKYRTYERSAGPLAQTMKTEMPGVANTCRYTPDIDNVMFSIGERSVYAAGVFADSSIFSMLTLPFVEGNANDAFAQPYSMVLTEKTAKKLFGNEKNIVGKTVRADNKHDFVITGVIKDIPDNTTLQFEWIAPFEIYLKDNDRLNHWESNSILTLVELKKGASVAAVNNHLHSYIAKKISNNTVTSMLFSMNDWHLRNSFENGKLTGSGRIQYVNLFIIIAWIIILLACINFMNLATARSARRAKEVGVRKVLGSGRQKLIIQFMGESLFISFLATLTAIIIITLILPAFNTLTQSQLSADLFNPKYLLAIGSITIICGVAAGSYPSLLLSSFKPSQVLKGLMPKTGNTVFIRKGLVVVQFTASLILIICTIIIYQQILHLKNRDIGYSKDNLLIIPSQGNIAKNFDVVKSALLNTGIVEHAALANYETMYAGQNNDDYTWEGKDPKSKVLISSRGVSPEMLQTYGIKILQGRDFNPDALADSTNIIINESLAKMMKDKNVVSDIIMEGTRQYHIIGVARDFVYGDVFGVNPDPLIFYCTRNFSDDDVMYVRSKDHSNIRDALAKIEMVLKKDNPFYPFTYKFADDEFNEMFTSEMLVGKLSRLFAGFAIIISCLGLFGLAAYTAERRRKEFGIRKVLGASTVVITSLMSRDFIPLVLVSSLISFPIAWWAMNTWLQNYGYKIKINWWVFLAAAGIVLLFVIITISFQAIKAAIANPVKSLRTE